MKSAIAPKSNLRHYLPQAGIMPSPGRVSTRPDLPGPLNQGTMPSHNDRMAKQKFRPARLGGFSGSKAYIRYVEILKKRRNAAGRTFCDAIEVHHD
jgi:hypothetical protein